MGSNKYSFIEAKAEQLLCKLSDVRLPIDLDLVAKAIKVTLVAESLEDQVSGFFLSKDGKNTIGYNSTHHSNRQRFTIAHEIGHMLLHSTKAPLFIDQEKGENIYYRNEHSSTGEFELEREANVFAAALLMPRNLIEREFYKHAKNGSFNELSSKLAETFGVSEQAMSFRLHNLGLVDYGF